MEPLFEEAKYYSRAIVRAMLDRNMADLRSAMVANEVTVLVDAIDGGEDIEMLQIIADEVKRAANCETVELMEMARNQCHWENLDL